MQLPPDGDVSFLLVCSTQVTRFIDEDLKKFPSLDRKWKSNVMPTLIMKDGDGNVLESVDISRWQLKHIIEFLEAKLQPPKLSA